ncbi:MAG: hypothetical protein QW520_04710 [Methanomassiliicoccales archaeon]
MAKKKILIISFSKLDGDPRVYRQIINLSRKYEVTAAGLTNPNIEGVKFIQISIKPKGFIQSSKRAICLKTGKYEEYYRQTFDFQDFLNYTRERAYDLIIANDSDSLQLAFMISDGSNILHDAHEYSPGQQEEDIVWRFFMYKYRDYLCRKYLKKCKKVTTVSEGISNLYFMRYGVKSEVITNATEYIDIEPSAVIPGKIRMIHHGSAHKARKIEKMIELMRFLDERFSLDLMLIPTDKKYYFNLIKMIKSVDNIRFINPVPMKSIVKTINAYDVGIYFFEPVNLNYKYGLPNKIFEFIQARLAVAIGPSLEMVKIVKKYDCGLVASDFQPKSMAKILQSLTDEKLIKFKINSANAAKFFNAEANIVKMEKIIECIIN